MKAYLGHILWSIYVSPLCTTEEYIAKEKERMKTVPVYDETWTLNGNISSENKKRQKEETTSKSKVSSIK